MLADLWLDELRISIRMRRPLASASALAQQLKILDVRTRRVLRHCCVCADLRDPAAAHAQTSEILLLRMRRLQRSCWYACAEFRDPAAAHAQTLEILLLRMCTFYIFVLPMRRLLLIFLLRMRRRKRSCCSPCALFNCFAAVPWGTSPRSGWQSGRSALWRWWQCIQPPDRIRVLLDENFFKVKNIEELILRGHARLHFGSVKHW
jgi:hypothetical protein